MSRAVVKKAKFFRMFKISVWVALICSIVIFLSFFTTSSGEFANDMLCKYPNQSGETRDYKIEDKLSLYFYSQGWIYKGCKLDYLRVFICIASLWVLLSMVTIPITGVIVFGSLE